MSSLSMQQHNVSNSTSWNPSNNVAPSIILGFCCLLGIPGNVLVAVAILRNIRRATLTVRLMLNLALTDLLSLVLVLFWIPPLFRDWPYGAAVCKLLSFVLYCSIYSSVLTVTLMGVQRCLTVVFPKARLRLHAGQRSEKALLAGLWMFALVFASPMAALRNLNHDNERLRCQPLYESNMQKVSVLLAETLLGFVLPAILLSTSYFCIAQRVGQLFFTPKKRLSRLVTWVVSSFIIFWCPTHVANMLHISAALVSEEQSDRLRLTGEWIQNFAGALTFFNSCLNPFLYAFASRSLRGKSSIMKRLERVCHSKISDTPPRKGSFCPQGTNLTIPSQTLV